MQSKPFIPVKTADLEFDDSGEPYSKIFQDVYFSKRHGLEESRYVFLEGNQLPKRFCELTKDFCIAETGFGTGLNFLLTQKLWLEHRKKGRTLYYYAFEKYPLSLGSLKKVSSLFPDLNKEFYALIKRYPILVPGWHLLRFESIQLRLFIGEASSGLESLLSSNHPYFNQTYPSLLVDAYFLDGFNPKTNPKMWSESLFKNLASLAKINGTLATFSCARSVREGLIHAGFQIAKVKGFRHKREMLTAKYLKEKSLDVPRQEHSSKFYLPWYLHEPSKTQITNVAIIGGGLSSAFSAYFLREQGVNVSVYEQGKDLASNASGNPKGLLNLSLSSYVNAWSHYLLMSYLFAVEFYRSLGIESLNGLYKLITSKKEKQLLDKLKPILKAYPDLAKFVKGDEVAECVGLAGLIDKDALFLPNSGELSPKELCHQLLNQEVITLHLNHEIKDLKSHEKGWRINQKPYDAVIIATGNLANQFLQTQFLPVKSIAGEITFFPETKQTKTLHYPLCADGYLTTSLEGVHCLGATYEVGARSKKQSNVENLERLRQFINNPEECNPKALNSRVSVRATTPDYMPIIGAVPKADWFIDHYQELKKDANVFLPKAGAYYENLYVLTGFGSNGLTYGPLSASLLVNKMLNKPQAISTELLKALSPARFLIRDLCRGKI